MSDKTVPPPEEKESGYTPASPAKRAMAWTGVVYMVILVGLNTYFYFTGTMLTGLAPLLAVPGLIGLSVVMHLWMRERGRTAPLVLLSAVCIVLAVFSLLAGIPGLMANFGG